MKHLNNTQFGKYYHGSNVPPEVILKQGLKAHKPGEELDAMYGEDIGGPGHPKGVYFGADRETASNYGRHIYSVELPHKGKKWGWTESEGRVWTDDIPAHKVRLEPEED